MPGQGWADAVYGDASARNPHAYAVPGGVGPSAAGCAS